MKITTRKIASSLVAAALVGTGLMTLPACSSNDNKSNTANTENTAQVNTNENSNATTDSNLITKDDISGPYASGIHHVELVVDGYDPITIEVDADAAPVSTWNFCTLVNDGFYDGLSFYRFVEGFCMQGGSSNYSAASDPNSTAKHIVGEFAYNGIENPLAEKFGRGTVAMARSSDKDSADTTFFVTLGGGANVSASLNKQYAAFGTIDEDGMEIVDQIVSNYIGNVDDSSSGSISNKEKQAIIKSATVTD